MGMGVNSLLLLANLVGLFVVGLTLPKDNPCKCVPKGQCDSSLIINTRLKPCTQPSYVCCKTPQIPVIPDQKTGCGLRRLVSQSQDYNDERGITEFGEFPWVASLFKGNKTYYCAGSIIRPDVILTSTACTKFLKENEKITVRAGDWNIEKDIEPLAFQERAVDKVLVHPEAGKKVQDGHDVALLFLKEPFQFGQHVDQVCLSQASSGTIDRDRCIALGWGDVDEDKIPTIRPTMRSVHLPLVPRDQCQAKLQTNKKLNKDFILHKSFMCAGGEPGKDTCTGDGGGPLMCPYKEDPGRYVQLGIVSWGIGCGSSVPGVYTDVAYMNDWINSILTQTKH